MFDDDIECVVFVLDTVWNIAAAVPTTSPAKITISQIVATDEYDSHYPDSRNDVGRTLQSNSARLTFYIAIVRAIFVSFATK